MQILSPEVLTDAKGMSPALCVIGLLAGLALWLLGWRSHRFWAVLTITVVGGVVGLAEGPALRAQPLVAAVLLAVAAGMLALHLVKLIAFAAGGVTFLAAAQTLGPPGEGTLVFFLAGGLMGLLLFRLWVMTLTSLAGTLLLAYSVLCLLDGLGKIDGAEWAGGHRNLMNWACTGVAILGLGLQLLLNRKKGEGKAAPPKVEPPPEPAAGWIGGLFRKAG